MFQDLRFRCSNATFRYISHSAVVICCESARPCRTGEKEGDESDPPQKWGGMRSRIAGVCSTPLSGPMRVALVLIGVRHKQLIIERPVGVNEFDAQRVSLSIPRHKLIPTFLHRCRHRKTLCTSGLFDLILVSASLKVKPLPEAHGFSMTTCNHLIAF